MGLRNVLIAVKDIEKSKEFYKELFGLEVVLEQEGNVMLTEGLVLQQLTIWREAIGRDVNFQNNATMLYFEETNLEGLLEKLDAYGETIQYVNKVTKLPWGQKMVRFYDLDGNLIEVRTPGIGEV